MQYLDFLFGDYVKDSYFCTSENILHNIYGKQNIPHQR